MREWGTACFTRRRGGVVDVARADLLATLGHPAAPEFLEDAEGLEAAQNGVSW